MRAGVLTLARAVVAAQFNLNPFPVTVNGITYQPGSADRLAIRVGMV